jgi:8-oxo-dGTP pyrophosphatase MutT (NUDIX family)
VPAIRSIHVEVHLFRRRGRRVEFLILRRAASRRKLPGVWQPVTGKRHLGERAPSCAVREVLEETGLSPRRWWALETPTVFYDARADAFDVLPVFVAEIGARDRVRLSREHDAHRFVTARKAAARFLWETQRRALSAVRCDVLGDPAHARALEITASMIRRRPSGTRRG